MLRQWLRGLAAAFVFSSVAGGVARAESLAPLPAAGRLSVVTYNVAGLPAVSSQWRPVARLPVIGSLLNGYDLALVQEDFAYPLMLRERIRLPHASSPTPSGEDLPYGDGLSVFSRLPFGAVGREAWRRCNGVTGSAFDCLARKGFSFTRLELEPGLAIDVYNLHMDAGRSKADRAARASQLDQLSAAIRRRSLGRAVIVAGDFNLTLGEHERLSALLQGAGLQDACAELRCPDPDRIDRVLWRGSSMLELAAASWRVDPRFVDDERRPLSDHKAVAVDFTWRRTHPARARR